MRILLTCGRIPPRISAECEETAHAETDRSFMQRAHDQWATQGLEPSAEPSMQLCSPGPGHGTQQAPHRPKTTTIQGFSSLLSVQYISQYKRGTQMDLLEFLPLALRWKCFLTFTYSLTVNC